MASEFNEALMEKNSDVAMMVLVEGNEEFLIKLGEFIEYLGQFESNEVAALLSSYSKTADNSWLAPLFELAFEGTADLSENIRLVNQKEEEFFNKMNAIEKGLKKVQNKAKEAQQKAQLERIQSDKSINRLSHAMEEKGNRKH
jgi:small-conductance mechanosensitive channel